MPGFAADDTQEVSDPNSSLNRSNSLVSNSTASSAPVSLYNPVLTSPSSNGLVASAAPVYGSGGGSISGGGSTTSMSGSGSSSNYDFHGLTPSQQTALVDKSQAIGANPADFYAVMNKETGGKFSPATPGPGGEIGLIQFSKDNQKKYGVSPDQTFEEQLDASAKYLQDRGWKPGMGLAHMYSIVNAGSLKANGEPRYNYHNRTGSIKSHVADIQQNWYPKSKEDTIPEGGVEPLSEGIQQVMRTTGYAPSIVRSNNPSNGLVDAAAANAEQAGLFGKRPISAIQPLTGGVDKSAGVLASPGAASEMVPNYEMKPHVAQTDVEPLSPGIADVVRLGGDLGAPAPYKFGDNSEALKDHQQVLADRGYYKGKIDGDFGKQTRTAVRSLQRDMGLKDTGVIDADLAQRMGQLRRMTKSPDSVPLPAERPKPVIDNQFPGRPEHPGMAPTEVPAAAAESPVDAALKGVVAGGQAATGGLSPAPAEQPSMEVQLDANGHPIDPEEGLSRIAQTMMSPSAMLPGDLNRAPRVAAAPEYSAPPGSVPVGDRIKPAPAAPTAIDRAQQNLERKQQFDKMYNDLPAGSLYVSPDGKTRRKSGGKTSGRGSVTASENKPLQRALRTDENRGIFEGDSFIPSFNAGDMTDFSDPQQSLLKTLPRRYTNPDFRPVDQGDRDNAQPSEPYRRTL